MKHQITNPLGRLAQRPRLLTWLIAALDESWAALRREVEIATPSIQDENSFRLLFVQSIRMLNPAIHCQSNGHDSGLSVELDNETVSIGFTYCLSDNHNVDNNLHISSRFLLLLSVDSSKPNHLEEELRNDNSRFPEEMIAQNQLQEIHRLPAIVCPSTENSFCGTFFMLTDDPMTIEDMFQFDRTAFSVVDLEDEGDDRDEWFRRTPRERLAAIEYLRQTAYGQSSAQARLQRILDTVEPPPC